VTVAAAQVKGRISPDWARKRLERLRSVMAAKDVSVAVLHESFAVHHAAGATSMHGWPSALVVSPDRAVAGFFATGEQEAGVDEQIVLRGIRADRPVDHAGELAEAVRPVLTSALAAAATNTVGLELDTAPHWLTRFFKMLPERPHLIDLRHELVGLRRPKDPDELGVIRFNVAICEAAYQAALETVRPGVTELDVFAAIRSAAEDVAGTSVPLGGDFAAGPGGGERGGPPSRRLLEEGDSFVIDIWPSLGGYWADMARTLPVGKASPELRRAIELTNEALDLGAAKLEPGARAADVDRAMRGFLGEQVDLGGGDYFNLSGHGLGLAPHEAPWILSDSEDTIQVGDVVTLEPGLYGASLRGGVRTEDNYLVREDGLENLCSFPRFLA
jgi:Xaa-Pro dipeptidase